jgi:PAS domain S-box-containing protein
VGWQPRYVLGPLPAGWPDLAPYAFPIVELLLAWNLTRWHLLDIAPVTRDLSVQGMSDGILVIDRQACIVDVNPAARRTLGWAEERIGQPIGDVLALDLIPAMRRAAGSEMGVEVQLSSNGHLAIDELSHSPLRDRRGQPSGQLLALHDGSKRHELLVAEQAARRAAESG